MTSDEYLRLLLDRHLVASGPLSPAEQTVNAVAPELRRWAGSDLNEILLSSSYAKKTAVRGSSDIDVFLSLRSTEPLRDIYNSLFDVAATNGWGPRRQNVSIGITLGQVNVDLVPGRVQPGGQNFHSLYRSKLDSWTQTNVSQHIALVRNSGRTDEIRALKIWRNRWGFEFPSFYLELVAIEALKWSRDGLADNVFRVFRYIDSDPARTRFVDPANSANIVSEDLTAPEKVVVLTRAREALAAKTWDQSWVNEMSNRLHDLLSNLQKLLESELAVARGAHQHPVAKGGASEADWIGVLRAHLPARYSVGSGFVVDSVGQESEQIDVIVYDAQYSALVFNRHEMLYVPAESVYAVFEAKQELNKKHIGYAMTKAASVRQLHRTSVPITHAGGSFSARPPLPIIAGILALESTWSPPFGNSFVKAAASNEHGKRLDIGCAVKRGAFELVFAKSATPSVSFSSADLSLATLLLTLQARLQDGGTVPAMDYRAYLRGVGDES